MRSINEHRKKDNKEMSRKKIRAYAAAEKAKAPDSAMEAFKRKPYSTGKEI